MHFVSMSSRTQMAMAVLVFGFLCWVAYASVNVVFKEQIILAKDRNFRLMEATLQRRISDNQRAYDEINILNTIIRDEFDAAMRELNGRHLALEAVVEEKKGLDDQLDALAAALESSGQPGGRPMKNGNRVMVDSVGREPTPRASKTPRLREAALGLRMEDGRFDPATTQRAKSNLPADDYMRMRVREMRDRQDAFLIRMEEDIQLRVAELNAILNATGIESEMMIAQSRPEPAVAGLAVGGPLVALADAEEFVNGGLELETISNEIFFRHSYRIANHLDRLKEVKRALASVPLAMPLKTRYRLSSEFGTRSDPFTSETAFHPGMDFGADWKSPVLATAPGVISFVGTRTGYGRTVEIDHGNGFKTRYAHLHRITVKRGQKVELHDTIGLVGSTGRATGPHLHYEVHFNRKLRNPKRFIEAGRYVFES